jgi:hypothetical protein
VFAANHSDRSEERHYAVAMPRSSAPTYGHHEGHNDHEAHEVTSDQKAFVVHVFSLLAPCGTGASAPSVRHRIYEMDHYAMSSGIYFVRPAFRAAQYAFIRSAAALR